MLCLLLGLLEYELAIDFPVRCWQVKKQLIHLNRALAESKYRVNSLRRITERTELNFSFFQQRKKRTRSSNHRLVPSKDPCASKGNFSADFGKL